MEQKGKTVLFTRIAHRILRHRQHRGRAIGFYTAVFFGCFIWASPIQAALFGFAAEKGAHEAGEVFTVTVYVSSPDQALNAVSGVVTIPPTLDVTSLSQTGSVVGFWVQAPVFSASARSVSFEGVVLNPGYRGEYGTLFQMQVRANQPGTSAFKLQSGAILAHDGQGSNIMERSTGMSVVIGASAAEAGPESLTQEEGLAVIAEEQDATVGDTAIAEEQPVIPTQPPRAPRLQSSTHPEPDIWYGLASPLFTWSLPRGVTAARVGVSRGATDAPVEMRRGAISSYQVSGLEDGVWFVHVQLQNALGWGPVSHRAIRIDTQSPTAISLQEIERKDLSDPDVQFMLSATDHLSGVERFAVRLDDAEEYTWVDDHSHAITLSDTYPGIHALSIRALDNAGNATTTSVVFFVDALEAPFLENVPEQLQVGEELMLHGNTRYASAQVVLWLERDGQEAMRFLTTSDMNGDFSFTIRERMMPGRYAISAEIVDARGARSNRSQEFPVFVQRAFGEYTFYLVGILAIGAFIFAGLFWRERSLRGARVDIGKEEDELLMLAHRMREKLRTLESRERVRRRLADSVLAKTEAELGEELGDVIRTRKRRK